MAHKRAVLVPLPREHKTGAVVAMLQRGPGVVATIGKFETPDELVGPMREFFAALPHDAQRAFLTAYEGGRFAPDGPQMTGDLVVGKFLVENAGTREAAAVGEAYAKHPAKVAAFVEVARQTYVLSTEVASGGSGVPQLGLGDGRFTWEGVFDWLESSSSKLTAEQQENIRDGMYATHFAQSGSTPLSVAEAKKQKGATDDLRKPGILLAARDLSGRVSIGTHQFLILIPEHPENFDNLVDLGDGTMGVIVGAYDHKGRLIAAINDYDDLDGSGSDDEALSKNDLDATRELYNPNKYTSIFQFDYSTIHRRVHLSENQPIDDSIREVLVASENYKRNEDAYNIPYPKWYQNIHGAINNSACINSNSFAQSILRYVVSDPRVEDDIRWYFAIDACHAARIGDSYFQ